MTRVPTCPQCKSTNVTSIGDWIGMPNHPGVFVCENCKHGFITGGYYSLPEITKSHYSLPSHTESH